MRARSNLPAFPLSLSLSRKGRGNVLSKRHSKHMPENPRQTGVSSLLQSIIMTFCKAATNVLPPPSRGRAGERVNACTIESAGIPPLPVPRKGRGKVLSERHISANIKDNIDANPNANLGGQGGPRRRSCRVPLVF